MRLHTKCTLLIIGIAMGFGILTAALGSRNIHAILDNKLEEKANLIAQMLAAHTIQLVIDNEVVAVRDALTEASARSHDLVFAYITDFDGNVFAHSFKEGFPVALMDITRNQGKTIKPIVKRFNTENGPLLIAVRPLIPVTAACVYVGISETSIADQVWAINRIHILSIIGISLAGIAIGIFLTRRIINPIQHLANSMHAYGSGKIIPIIGQPHGGYEVNELICAFNKMLTDRNKIESSLRDHQERLELALWGADLGLWDLDLRSQTVIFNQRWAQIMDISLQNSICRLETWRAKIHPDDLQSAIHRMQGHIDSTTEFYEAEYRVRTQSGGYRWVLDRGKIVSRDADNRPTRMVGTFLDISDRKRTEQDHRLLSAALDQLVEGIIITDRQGKIQYVNPGFENMTGYRKEEVIAKTPAFLKSGYHSPETYRQLWETITHGKTWRDRLTSKRKDGSLYEEEIGISPVFGAAGKIRNFVSVSRDISREVQIEAQLRQVQKMEALGTLAGGIAHDFNNVLVPIIGFTEITLADLPRESPLRKNLLEILKATTRAKALVQQILTFSRQSVFERKPLLMQPIIKEALKLLRSSIPTNIEFVQKIDSDCGAILGDPTQIHQIVMNLCTNAYHAMQETGGVLEVSLTETTDPSASISRPSGLKLGRYACLKVKDTGCGIDPTVMDRIFEPYFTTKEQSKGTGLGLAVVHGIVKSYEGDITVFSKPGEGTVIEIFFPIIESGLEKQTTDEFQKHPTGSERILLVDDEEPIVTMVGQMLRRLGYQVKEYIRSEDALFAFKADPDHFDLIITDMAMPGMTGAQLAQECMKIRPHMPIILCSGFSDVMDRETALSIGIKEYLIKPVSMEKMANILRDVLDNR